MKKVYVSPSNNHKGASGNPYIKTLKETISPFCEVLEADNKPCYSQAWRIFVNAFKADVFLLSFVETIAFHKLAPLQTLLAILGLSIAKLRHLTIVFFFHNPVAHQGENWMTRLLFKSLFSYADYVVVHSDNTAAIARAKFNNERVIQFPHPVYPLETVPAINDGTDVLIWGTVFPYKGVLEFISDSWVQQSDLKVLILGACPNKELAQRIHEKTNQHIRFDERWAGMDEIASRIAGARYVLFPFLPASVSGSASLMDTLRYGGNAIGPDAGAFHDMAQIGLCKVYHSPDDLHVILSSHQWAVNQEQLKSFLDEHSWESFINTLIKRIPGLS